MFTILSSFIIKRYKHIFVFSITCFVIALLIASKIGMDSNMEGMLPANSESLKASMEYEEAFDSQDNVLVVVRGDSNQAEAYIEELGERLMLEKTVSNVLYKVEMDTLDEYFHLYIDSKYYRNLESDLNDYNSSLSNFLRNKDFASFSNLFTERLDNADEESKEKLFNLYAKLLSSNYDLSEHEEKELFSALIFGELLEIQEDSKYIVNDSMNTYLMVIKPNIAMENFMKDRVIFFNRLEGFISHTKDAGNYNVEVGITGGAFVQDNEADNTMFNGFFSTAFITFILIILFIVLSFRRLILPLAAGFPLLLGALLATAFAYLAYKNLNMFSISFAVLLLGLGIDFAVHIISRYLEERGAGRTVRDAVTITIKETSSGMLVGATTTAIAFLTFLIAEFKAFTQMGVISGMGIFILCITMIFLMPTIILLMDIKKSTHKPIKESGYTFLMPIGKTVEKRPLVLVIIVGIVALSLLGNVLNTEIKTDMSKIYPQDMESLTWLEVVEEEFDYNPTSLIFMVDSIEELMLVIAKFSNEDGIKRLDSILEYMPQEQDYKINVINQLNEGLNHRKDNEYPSTPMEIIGGFQNIKDAANRNGIATDSEGYRRIEEIIDSIEGDTSLMTLRSIMKELSFMDNEAIGELQLGAEKLTIEQLPDSLKSNFVGKDGKLSVEAIPNKNIWESENYNTIASAIKDASGRNPVGMPAIMNEVTIYVKKDILKISLFCITSLFIILLIMFRSIKDAFIILIPLLLTIFMTLGIVPIFKTDLNIFSVIAFPVLIGIGVDSGVHLLHRIKTSQDKDIPYILTHTGKAIMMTTITTLIGFGSLYFTNHPGLSSFGLLTIVGMSLCLVLTLTLLPALYLVLYRKDIRKIVQPSNQ
ncbi:efflux RND transporter permease subunit [Alkaliphilus peptidifermentans]|uniref:Predicted exporter protein, RND superfamily n=1 Tax=Alkaliphilus peptidifermentans DSM 18978 TaxID=1120976 RepID=A0A1G5FX77_9FIRM|nr:MMPL family transporter [Alkaliphilus peptidifermentans]SCY43697.1 Predicted exporter protein, RND superfamily [Alkaliphilus peptidifermentans DSM 18978]